MRYLFATLGITVTTAADVLLMSGDGDMVLKRTTNKHGIQYHKDMTGSSTYYNLLAVAYNTCRASKVAIISVSLKWPK